MLSNLRKLQSIFNFCLETSDTNTQISFSNNQFLIFKYVKKYEIILQHNFKQSICIANEKPELKAKNYKDFHKLIKNNLFAFSKSRAEYRQTCVIYSVQ